MFILCFSNFHYRQDMEVVCQMKAELGAVPCVLSNIELIVGTVLVPFQAFVPRGLFVLLYLFVYCIVDCVQFICGAYFLNKSS